MNTIWLRLIAGLALSLFAAGSCPQATSQCLGMSVLGRITSVPGNPFQAEVHMTISTGTEQRVRFENIKEEIVSRDSQGRVRIDHQVQQGKTAGDEKPTDEHHCVSIFDPVSGEAISLDTLKKIAVVQKLSSFMLRESQISLCQAELRAVSKQELDDLGHLTIEGLDAQGLGERKTKSESWCSSELQTAVLVKFMVKPGNPAVSRIAMTDIQRVEPDAALFVIPTDFKTTGSGNVVLFPLTPSPAAKSGLSQPVNREANHDATYKTAEKP